MLKQKFARLGVIAGGAATSIVLAPSASAQTTPPDFSGLTAAIDLSSVITAVMAVGAVMVGVYVAIKGAKIVLQMVRGA